MPRLPQDLNDSNIVLHTRLNAMVSGHGIKVKERLLNSFRVGTSIKHEHIGVAGWRHAFLHQLKQPQRLVSKTVHGVAINHDVPRVDVPVRHIVERPAGVGHGSALGIHLEQLVVDTEVAAERRAKEEVVHLPELLEQLRV
uniref:Uncharacterized protein n=1 Tax=Arundo donax TaxID=35708 RepID=A0A0A9E1B0_ARUDO